MFPTFFHRILGTPVVPGVPPSHRPSPSEHFTSSAPRQVDGSGTHDTPPVSQGIHDTQRDGQRTPENVGKWWNMWKIRWKMRWKIHKHICEIMWTYVNIELIKKMQKGSTCRNKWGLDFINFYFSRLIMNIWVSKQLCQGQVSILHCCWLFPFRSTAYSFHFVW